MRKELQSNLNVLKAKIAQVQKAVGLDCCREALARLV